MYMYIYVYIYIYKLFKNKKIYIYKKVVPYSSVGRASD